MQFPGESQMRSKRQQIEAVTGCYEFLRRIANPKESPRVPLYLRYEARGLLMRLPDPEELKALLTEHLSEPPPPALEQTSRALARIRARYEEDGKLDGKLAELLHEAYCRVGVSASPPQGS